MQGAPPPGMRTLCRTRRGLLLAALLSGGHTLAAAPQPPRGLSQGAPLGRCGPLTVTTNAATGAGFNADVFGWHDRDCRARVARLARPSPSQAGGYLYDLAFHADGARRLARGTNAGGWNGWGFVVLHYAQTAATTQGLPPTFSGTVLAGRHHALHRFRWRLSAGGPVDATVDWLFVTGRDEPLFAVTLDSSPAGADVVKADSRAPYGDLAFEGEPGDIGGLGWGDARRFTTRCAGALTPQCAWDYQQPNTVPFVRMWSRSVDAEQGAVQTTSDALHPGGGDYGGGMLAAHCRGRTSQTAGPGCCAEGTRLPVAWLWPYQLSQYELPFTATSHRLAWGQTYGAVGQTTYQHFGKALSGYPYQSYSVFLVLGPRTPSATLGRVAAMERLLGARLTVSEGEVLTEAPGGVGRADAVRLDVPGYDPTYATFDVRAASGRATFTLEPLAGPVDAPVFRVHGQVEPPTTFTLDGGALTPDVDVFVTHDAVRATTWLTLRATVVRPVTLQVR